MAFLTQPKEAKNKVSDPAISIVNNYWLLKYSRPFLKILKTSSSFMDYLKIIKKKNKFTNIYWKFCHRMIVQFLEKALFKGLVQTIIKAYQLQVFCLKLLNPTGCKIRFQNTIKKCI